jgi:hypothetical protein
MCERRKGAEFLAFLLVAQGFLWNNSNLSNTNREGTSIANKTKQKNCCLKYLKNIVIT